jgi:hypothetical protein
MTAEFENFVGLLLVILTIICILQVFFTGLLLWYVKRVMESLGGARAAALPPPAPAAITTPEPGAPRPEVPAAKAPAVGEGRPASPAPATAAPAVGEGLPASPAPATAAPAVDLLGGSPDIQGSILRLSLKHDLADFIITTLDGLLVVSLSPGASEEAARYSDLYRRKKKPDAPGVAFLELDHRGEAMLCVARSDRTLTPDQLRGIGEDAREILQWWL